MSRLRATARDVRALGAGAPLRAAYEGSKRAGGHAFAFGRLAARPPSTAVSRPVYRLPAATSVPATAVERTRREADEIVAGRIVLFGRTIDVGAVPDWHASLDPDAAHTRWPDGPWWQIDLRSAARVADVKWAWELGRHRHLVVLARATATADPDPAWRDALHRHLESWLHHNPPEHGVHWYSNLEIALRAMAWLELLAWAGPALDDELRRAMDAHLHHAGAHLLLDLPYTLSTMRNNHLLGDALGLLALARAFPDEPEARRWQRVGRRLLATQSRREVRPDGSMIEDSVSYHRFVVELLCRAALLGHDEVTGALRRSARFLCRLGALDGPVPQYGDWDEGRAIVASGDQRPLAGSTRLALALCGRGAPNAWREAHDEVAWCAAAGEPAPADAAQIDGHSVGGGVARVARGPLVVWGKAGGGPWHGHADHGSVAVRAGDAWLVGDPGTGNYNGRDMGRAFLRSSAAHSVLVLDGEDQLVPHRAFRWVYSATGRVGPPVALPGAQVLWWAHDAYRRLAPARRIARVVVVTGERAERGGGGEDGALVVADWVEGPPGPAWQLTLPFSPGSTWSGPDGVLRTADGTRARLTFLTDDVALEAGHGPWSDTYGTAEDAPRLLASGRVDGPVAWSLALNATGSGDGGPDAGAAHGAGPGGARHGDELHVAGAVITVAWRAGAVELVVDHPAVPPGDRPAVVL